MRAGINAYNETMKSTLSGRDLEASILSKAARLLKECQDKWDEEGHFTRLDEALVFNQRIWTIFQDELIRQDNPLPEQLRGNILSLSVFIDKRIVEIMRDPSPDKLDIIININQNIASGLRGSPP